MTWFKVDDGFWCHPKVLGVSAGAIRLWVLAGSWCAQHCTDGVVPASLLRTLRVRSAYATELVEVGLWDLHQTGYAFHDWTDYNPTREAVTAGREATKARVQAWRERHRNGVTNTVTGEDVTPLVTPPPTRPDPTRTSFGSTHVDVASQHASGGGEAPPRGGRRKASPKTTPEPPVPTAELVPLADVPGSDAVIRELPTPQHLVAGWIDGWRQTHDGADPTPAMIKRVAGKATELSRGLDYEGMREAWRTCVALGREGTWDVVGQQPRAQRERSPHARGNYASELAAELREAGL